MNNRRLLTLVSIALVAAIALAGAAACSSGESSEPGHIQAGDLAIHEPFARGAIDRGAVFFTVENTGDVDDALISASSDVAARVELHRTVMEGVSARMEQVPEIDVPAGEETVLQPGGLHVMLLDLQQPLAMGDKFSVTLEFERAGTVELEVEVRAYSEEPMGGMNNDNDMNGGGEGSGMGQ